MPTLVLDPAVLYINNDSTVNEDPSSVLPGVVISQHTVSLSTSTEFSFRLPVQYMETVLNDPLHPAHLDKTVIRQVDGRVLFKGLIKQHSGMTLDSESVTFECDAVENFIDNQEWTPAFLYYNTPGLLCNDREWKPSTGPARAATIGDFLSAEMDALNPTGGIQFFEAYSAPDEIRELVMPAVSTLKKGFFSVLQEVLAPFQHIKWSIVYNALTPLFPCGMLVLRDMTQKAVSPYYAQIPAVVGGATGRVLDLNVNYDISQVCEKTRLFAKGRLVERYEVLTPAWKSSDEQIYVMSAMIGSPLDAKSNLQLPESATFITKLNLWIHGIDDYSKLDSSIAHSARLRLWHGADFRINVETGEIEFMRLDDVEGEWWWVDNQTGRVYAEGEQPLNFGGIQLRRPIAYNDVHAEAGTYYEAEYYHIGRNAYRKYKTKWPIADIRLVRAEYPDPEDPLIKRNDLVQASTSFECYIPKVAAQRFNIEEDPTVNIAGNVFTDPTTGDIVVWADGTTAANKALSEGVESAQDLDPEEVEIPDDVVAENERRALFGLPDLPVLPLIKANMLFPAGVATALTKTDVIRHYVESNGGATFEDGDNCVILSTPQLMALPEWYDTPNTGPTDVGDPYAVAWMTWTVVAHYTSWTQYVVEKPSPSGYGKGRTYRGVSPSIMQYVDATDPAGPTVLFDNLADLETLATTTADYFGNPVWSGSISFALDIVSNLPVIPMKVGDVVTVSGKCLSPINGLISIITQIDYSNIDSAKLTVSIGKAAPPKNPFIPRKIPGLVLEGESANVGTSGLQDL